MSQKNLFSQEIYTCSIDHIFLFVQQKMKLPCCSLPWGISLVAYHVFSHLFSLKHIFPMYLSCKSWDDTTHSLVSKTVEIASSLGKQGIHVAKLEKNKLNSNFTLNTKEKRTERISVILKSWISKTDSFLHLYILQSLRLYSRNWPRCFLFIYLWSQYNSFHFTFGEKPSW